MSRPFSLAFGIVLGFASLVSAGTPERTPVIDAYKSGKIRLVVAVDSGTPDGGKVRISVENTGTEPMRLVVPKGRTVFPAGMPLENFTIEVAADKPLDVEKDGASAFEAPQKGAFRALAGKFTLRFFEGEPSFTGSVEAGPVAER
jgi:hypothetical protein